MNRTAALLLVLPLLVPALSHAQPAIDERAIMAAANALDAAIDDKDWERARSLLLDEVSVSLPGVDEKAMPADELVARWRTVLHEGKTSFHMRGGERVTFDGADSAVLHSKGQLWQHLPGLAGDDRYERWADYHHELDRGEDGAWRVRHYGYVTRLESGNLAVLEHRLPASGAEEAGATGDGSDGSPPPDASSGTAADTGSATDDAPVTDADATDGGEDGEGNETGAATNDGEPDADEAAGESTGGDAAEPPPAPTSGG